MRSSGASRAGIIRRASSRPPLSPKASSLGTASRPSALLMRALTPMSAETTMESHALQRIQLCSSLETAFSFRRPSFSAHLQGLMRREEDDNSPPPSLTARINSLLIAETERGYRGQHRIRLQKWQCLLRRHRVERSKLTTNITRDPDSDRNARAQNTSSRCPIDVRPGSLTLEDFREREAHMRQRTAQLWGESEQYAIETAIQLQLERLDADWTAHREKLTSDFFAFQEAHVQRETSRAGLREGSRDARWQGREKQSRLVHTAPVIHPDTSPVVSSSRISSEKLERAYQTACDQLEKQRAAAARWIERQKIQFLTHVRVLAEEKILLTNWIAGACEKEKEIIQSLRDNCLQGWPHTKTGFGHHSDDKRGSSVEYYGYFFQENVAHDFEGMKMHETPLPVRA